MTTREDYIKAWRRFRILNWSAILVIPISVLVLNFAQFMDIRLSYVVIVFLIFMFVFGIVGMTWKCPRCGSYSSESGLSHSNFLVKACRVCGLKRYEIPEDVK